MAKLIVKQRGAPEFVYHLLLPVVQIGRSANADLLLPHKSVSRRQARVERNDEETYTIHDMGSLNGMLVNGVIRKSHVLKDGDCVELGFFKMTFRADPVSAPPPLPTTPESTIPIDEAVTRLARRGPDGRPIIPELAGRGAPGLDAGVITGGLGPAMGVDTGGRPVMKRPNKSPRGAPVMNKSRPAPRTAPPPSAPRGPRATSMEELLANAGMEQYTELFAENEITLDLLDEISDQDLRDLGITKLGPRKKIMREIRRYLEGR